MLITIYWLLCARCCGACSCCWERRGRGCCRWKGCFSLGAIPITLWRGGCFIFRGFWVICTSGFIGIIRAGCRCFERVMRKGRSCWSRCWDLVCSWGLLKACSHPSRRLGFSWVLRWFGLNNFLSTVEFGGFSVFVDGSECFNEQLKLPLQLLIDLGPHFVAQFGKIFPLDSIIFD